MPSGKVLAGGLIVLMVLMILIVSFLLWDPYGWHAYDKSDKLHTSLYAGGPILAGIIFSVIAVFVIAN